MFNDKKFIAVIPARSGSKGLPGKNIKELCGKPLIVYTIETALKSKVFDKVIVSTDSMEIAEIAKKAGAEIPFLRPKELATDTADSMDVLIDAIKFLEEKGEKFDYIMKLQPTSPLRTEEDIRKSVKLLFEKNADSIISISECQHHPLWCNTIDKDLKMYNFIKEEIKNKNRQELPKYYEINGLIFLSNIEKLLKLKEWYGKNSYAYISNNKNAIDIDNIIDFNFVENLMRNKEC